MENFVREKPRVQTQFYINLRQSTISSENNNGMLKVTQRYKKRLAGEGIKVKGNR